MTWNFDQLPNSACITCRSVIEGRTVLLATHYDEDHSWAFLDGQPFSAADALVVAMSEVIDIHPDLDEISNLPPGWSATRVGLGEPWSKEEDDF